MNSMAPYYSDENGHMKIFKCDNIDLLRALPPKSVNLIYCDVLYNTGKQFDDYNDNLGSPEEAMKWYRPRIQEMARILADNGSIFIHCNWRLDGYMRVLLDHVFGYDNYRQCIHRRHSKADRGFYSNFDSQMDVIFYYVKDRRNFVFHEAQANKVESFPLFENGFIEGRSEVRDGINLAALNKHWLVSKADYEKLKEREEVVLVRGLPYRFTRTVPIGNLWDTPDMLDTYNRTATAVAYDTPKPEAVLERIISMCSNEGDTVADFFLGGGTSAVVAKRLGRKFIGCDISEKACKITIDKLESQ